MEIEKQSYFTTGEFARLCSVKKDTLFHYDEIGILKPEFIAENGYRYYSMKQFFLFDIISVLKKAGTSLKEIKAYIQNQNPEHFLELLKSKQELLHKEKLRIEKMETLLENTISLTKKGLNQTNCQLRIEQHPEEYFIAFPLPETTEQEEKERFIQICQNIQNCTTYQLGNEFPVGCIVKKENLEKGNFTEDYYCSKTSQKIDSPYFYLKPKGTFAVTEHYGSYETLPNTYQKLIAFIQKNGWKISGDCYEYELLNYLAVGDPNKYILELSIQISPNTAKNN